MTTNSQNPAKGKAFEQRVGKHLRMKGCDVKPDYAVEVSVNDRQKKSHKFDWGSDTLLVECKAYSWTEGGNSPSAKFATANEAMLYFVAATGPYKKMLFMPKTGKVGKLRPATLVEKYVQRYGHFIPDGVEIYELNESDLSATCAWPPQTKLTTDTHPVQEAAMTTVGNGKYTYEQVENWEKLPEGWELGQTAIVTDSEDRVYLFNRSEHPLIVLDRNGNYLASWGEGVLTDAHGMFIDEDQNLYLPVKNSHVVLKYDPKGNLLMTMGEWDKPSDTGWSGNYSDPAVRAAGPFNRPSDIAISPDGLLYISDGYGNARVHRFTPDGELVDSWGAPGKTGHGEFHVPHGVWVHTDGRVFVADRENNRIQIFDSEGSCLEQWLNLARPCDIYIDDDEAVYVPELDGFMTILDIEGDILARWGSPSDAGWGNGAHAVWVDSHGDIYVNQNLEGKRLIKYRHVGG